MNTQTHTHTNKDDYVGKKHAALLSTSIESESDCCVGRNRH